MMNVISFFIKINKITRKGHGVPCRQLIIFCDDENTKHPSLWLNGLWKRQTSGSFSFDSALIDTLLMMAWLPGPVARVAALLLSALKLTRFKIKCATPQRPLLPGYTITFIFVSPYLISNVRAEEGC